MANWYIKLFKCSAYMYTGLKFVSTNIIAPNSATKFNGLFYISYTPASNNAVNLTQ